MRSTLLIGLLATPALLLSGCNNPEPVQPPPHVVPEKHEAPKPTPAGKACLEGLDETNLAATANCFYSVGGKYVKKGNWRLVAKQSQEQLKQEEFEKDDGPETKVSSVEVLGEEAVKGTTYARVVSHWAGRSGGNACVTTTTQTWVKEDGKWRRIKSPRLEETTRKQFRSSDYAAAYASAERWLEEDPFSVDANMHLAMSVARMGDSKSAPKHSPLAEVVKSLLAINPKDDNVLFVAASFTAEPEIAKSFFARLPKEECNKDEVAYNVATKLTNVTQRLAFLDEVNSTGASVTLLRVTSLKEANKPKDAAAALTPSEAAVRTFLTGNDSTFAAARSAELGALMLSVGDAAKAREWLNFGVDRDPNDAALRALAKKLGSK